MIAYEKASNVLLSGLYHEIQRNIKRGLLSNNMESELELISIIAKKRGLYL
ncbi:hypothetical protein [Thalassobacillus sp. C254]|uniref:hypothetical protein n=1 Tax=Thalassobacillus sp. C254 TaxID=1225341 RepID=UPI0018DD1CEF|nr:hypothetical protein [Thalassobacillus sp. C254]